MFNKVIDLIMELVHHLLGSLLWKVDHAKKRRNKKKHGFTFIKRVAERGVTLDGSRGLRRKWK